MEIKKEMNCMFFNCRGLTDQKEVISLYVDKHNLDVVNLVETWK